MKSVLICSSSDDKHALAVAEELRALGAKCTIRSLHELANDYRVESTFTNTETKCILRSKAQSQSQSQSAECIELDKLDSIWWRRPGGVAAPPLEIEWMARMAQMESSEAYLGLLRNSGALWVNHPTAEFGASYKVHQLKVAREKGLLIPESIVTDEPNVVSQFFADCKGKVIYKLIGERTSFEIPLYETPRGIVTQPLREADLPFLEQVCHCPHLFQRMLDKSFEIRVTVIGAQLFAARIDSQSGKGSLDWRLDYTVPIDAFDLPDEVAQACLELTRTFGLNFAAIDLCVEKDGSYVFLELNPSGQFMWQEKRSKQPLAASMAKLLALQSEPLV